MVWGELRTHDPNPQTRDQTRYPLWDLVIFVQVGLRSWRPNQPQSRGGLLEARLMHPRARVARYSSLDLIFCYSCLPRTASSRRPLTWTMRKFTRFCCRSIQTRSITRSVPKWLMMLVKDGTFLFGWHSSCRFVRLCLVAFVVVHLDMKFTIAGSSSGSQNVVYPFCFSHYSS